MQEEALSKTFHLNNPRPIDWSKLVSYINSVGFPVEEISYNAWQERASKDIRSVENSIYLLLPFFVERWSEEQLTIPELYERARRPYIDCESTLNMLANTSIVCPPVDEKLLDKYFSYFARNKFLSY